MALSENSKFILNELELENSGLNQSNEVLPDRSDESIVYIDVYENPARKLDAMQEMYNKLDQINSKKEQISTLCNQAFTDGNCTLSSSENFLYGNGEITLINIVSSPVGASNGTYSNISASGGSGTGATFDVVVQSNSIESVTISNAGSEYSIGDVLTINGTSIGMPENGSGFDLTIEVSETDEDNIMFSETGTTFRTLGIPPFFIYQTVAFGVIRRDRIRVIYYPQLENYNSLPSSNNSQDGLIFPRITSNSQFRGKGRKTILSANSSYNDGVTDYRIRDDDGNWGVDGLKRGSGWSGGDNIIGRFYKLTGDCDGRRDDINELIDDIIGLRSQINDILDPINSLKEKKHGYQLKSWSYRRNQKINNDTIDENNALKDLINDPEYANIFEDP